MDGTITTSTKVEYKKRRNPRAFRVWDSAILTAAMVHSAEIKSRLEEIALKEEIDLSDMKPTLISSEILYLLVDSYLDSYKSLLAESLIKTGNIKSHPNIH